MTHTAIPTSTSLDKTPQKRLLEREIADLENRLDALLTKIGMLKCEISEFESEYAAVIGPLKARLEELDRLLFKYFNISACVDDMFTFQDAEKVFDETMKSRQERAEEESKKRIEEEIKARMKRMSNSDKDELKQLYWKLAHIFHPDKTGGDERMMVRINKAYTEGDIDLLRELASENIPEKIETDTLEGLKRKRKSLLEQIANINGEIRILRRSEMFVTKKNMVRHGEDIAEAFDTLSRKLRSEIEKKENDLAHQMAKFGTTTPQTEETVTA